MKEKGLIFGENVLEELVIAIHAFGGGVLSSSWKQVAT